MTNGWLFYSCSLVSRTMYTGRRFASMYVFARYWPRIPERQGAHHDHHDQQQRQQAEHQAEQGGDHQGAVENATIPSNAYANKPQKLHFVDPATRSTFPYDSHFVRKPTQP